MVEFAPTVKPRSARPPSLSPLGALLTLFLVGYSLIIAVALYKTARADSPSPAHNLAPEKRPGDYRGGEDGK